jgi:hypothetical protein
MFEMEQFYAVDRRRCRRPDTRSLLSDKTLYVYRLTEAPSRFCPRAKQMVPPELAPPPPSGAAVAPRVVPRGREFRRNHPDINQLRKSGVQVGFETLEVGPRGGSLFERLHGPSSLIGMNLYRTFKVGSTRGHRRGREQLICPLKIVGHLELPGIATCHRIKARVGGTSRSSLNKAR